MSDFASGAATWQTRRKLTLSLILPHWPVMQKHDVNTSSTKPTNRKYITYCTQQSTTKLRPKLIYVQRILWSWDVWYLRHASGQTDRQTDRHAECNTAPTYPGAKWSAMITHWLAYHFLKHLPTYYRRQPDQHGDSDQTLGREHRNSHPWSSYNCENLKQ